MRNNNLSLLSGRVKKVSSTSAASDRYTWLDLKNAEPDAGVPSAHSSTRGIFASDTSGIRDWLYADAGLSVDTATGYITVNENTVFIDTTGFLNSTSNNLADVLFDLDQNLGQTQQQTLSSVATDDTIDGNGTSGSPLSIGQGVRYSDDPTFSGLAINASLSISNIALTNPLQVTTSATHSIADGDAVTFRDIEGTVELNGNTYYADSTGATTFTLYSDPALTTPVDGTTGFTTYSTGGAVMTGGYIFPDTDSTDGQYLKTNGYGILEFDRPIAYGGSQPTDPDTGDMWYDSVTTNDLLIYNGTAFVSATGGGQSGAFTLVQFTGDGTTTQFDTQSPSVQKVIVFLNGILLRLTDDYTYSLGVITFNAAPRTGDTIEVLLTGNASLIDLATLGIANHNLITVDSNGNVTLQGTLDMDGNPIINLPTPTNGSDAATKAYVDSQLSSFSGTLDFAGDTGTDTLDLGTDTLTVSGTANEIETAVTDNNITIGLPDSVTITTGLTTPQLSFGTDATLSWNTVDGTVDIEYGNGVALQLGQEQHYYAKATENIANGDVVMFAGAQGDHILIAKADVTAPGFIDPWVVGIATQDFNTNDFGYVTSFGKVRGIDTNTPGWSLGDLLYLDPTTPGGLTNVEPTSPNHIILMAAVIGTGPANGVLLVRPTFNSYLDELHDVFVDTNTLATDQIISWNNTAERWENKFLEIGSLGDVNLSTPPTSNQTLVWDAGNGEFIAGDSFSQADFDTAFALKSVDDLSDVDLTTTAPTDAQVLIWDNANTKFVPADINEINGQITAANIADASITSVKIAPGAYVTQSFTGDGVTTDFTLSNDPGLQEATLVLVENVVQTPGTNYTVTGTTLSFSSAPDLNTDIFVRFLGLPQPIGVVLDNSVTNEKLNLTYTSNQYTGDGTTTDFTVAAGHTVDSVLVIINGLVQPPSDYTISGTTLTFLAAPLNGQAIDIRYMPV